MAAIQKGTQLPRQSAYTGGTQRKRYDRPGFSQRSFDLDQLAKMLTAYQELGDKRQARCWSPTFYADGVTSRSNAGVAEIGALEFDLDRLPPDPGRLEGVCWIGHTTWSHTTVDATLARHGAARTAGAGYQLGRRLAARTSVPMSRVGPIL